MNKSRPNTPIQKALRDEVPTFGAVLGPRGWVGRQAPRCSCIAKWIAAGAVLLSLALGSSFAYSQDPAHIEILSKEDAAWMFATSKTKWNANARLAQASGVTMAIINDQGVARMVVDYDMGIRMFVTPDYSSSVEGPDFIQVTVGYPPPLGTMFSDEVVADLILTTKRRMALEYMVEVSVDRIGEGIAFYFHIIENR